MSGSGRAAVGEWSGRGRRSGPAGRVLPSVAPDNPDMSGGDRVAGGSLLHWRVNVDVYGPPGGRKRPRKPKRSQPCPIIRDVSGGGPGLRCHVGVHDAAGQRSSAALSDKADNSQVGVRGQPPPTRMLGSPTPGSPTPDSPTAPPASFVSSCKAGGLSVVEPPDDVVRVGPPYRSKSQFGPRSPADTRLSGWVSTRCCPGQAVSPSVSPAGASSPVRQSGWSSRLRRSGRLRVRRTDQESRFCRRAAIAFRHGETR